MEYGIPASINYAKYVSCIILKLKHIEKEEAH